MKLMTSQRDRRMDTVIHLKFLDTYIHLIFFCYTHSISYEININPLEMFFKRNTSCMSPFSSNHHGPNYVLFSFKDWTLELGPSRETFRISPLHQRENVLFTTWHCWALNGDKWRGRHLLHRNFVSLWSTEFFFKTQQCFFSLTDFFLLSCSFFLGCEQVWPVDCSGISYKQPWFQDPGFSGLLDLQKATPIENMKNTSYWYLGFYFHPGKLT